jgi:hypothetical protein
MNITIEIDNEDFDTFYERVRAERQMRNGRAVDRKAARVYFVDTVKYLIAEGCWWGEILQEDEINLYVDHLDEGWMQEHLYRMIKEYTPKETA